MQIRRSFPRCIFEPQTIRGAIESFVEMLDEDRATTLIRRMTFDDGGALFDSDEEFLSEYAAGRYTLASYFRLDPEASLQIDVERGPVGSWVTTEVTVTR